MIQLLLLATCLAAAAGAQGDTDTPAPNTPTSDTWYEAIVVSATRSERSVLEIPLNATVISQEVLEQAPDAGVDEILRQIPSFGTERETSSANATIFQQAFSLRGLGGAAVGRALVMVDGIPLNDAYGGWALWSQVPKESLERVEVVRGGGSGVWGNIALSGVINLITREPEENQFRLATRLAEESTVDTTLSYSGVGERFLGSISGSFADTDGYHVVREDQRGPIDRPQAKRSVNARGKLSHYPSSRTVIQATAGLFTEDREKETLGALASNDAHSLFVAVDRVGANGGSFQLHTFGRESDWNNFVTSVAADRASERPSNFTFDQPSTFVGVSGQWSRGYGDHHSVLAGADWQSIEIERSNNSSFRTGSFFRQNFAEGTQRMGGIFAEEILSTSRWTFVAAARVDRIRSSGGHLLSTDLVTGEVTRDQSFAPNTEATFNPNLGFVFEAGPRTHLRGSAYTGFRAASPNELYVGFRSAGNRVTEANANLGPESLTGFELGADFSVDRRFFGRLTAFTNDTEDLISHLTIATVGPAGGFVAPCGFVGANGECLQRQNLGKVRIQGLEIEGELRPSASWRLALSGSLIDTEVREAARSSLIGTSLRRVPDERISASVGYRGPGGLSLLLRSRYTGERFDDDRNSRPIDDALLTDLSGSYGLHDRVSVYAGIENLFDEEPEVGVSRTVVRIGAPRRVHVGVRLRSR